MAELDIFLKKLPKKPKTTHNPPKTPQKTTLQKNKKSTHQKKAHQKKPHHYLFIV